MIKIKPHFMKVRNGKNGEFVDNLALKGAPGDIANLGSFVTHQAGYREDLVISQKGATEIRDAVLNEAQQNLSDLEQRLTDGVTDVDSARYAESAARDGNGNVIADTYATRDDVRSLGHDLIDHESAFTAFKNKLGDGDFVVGKADSATLADSATRAVMATATVGTEGTSDKARHVWFSETDYPNQRAFNENFKYNPGTDTLKVGKVDGTAASAVEVVGDEGTGNSDRHIWFSDYSKEAKRAFTDKFKYNPATDILTVGKVSGTATKATQDGNGNVIADTYAAKKLRLEREVEIEGGSTYIQHDGAPFLTKGLYCLVFLVKTNPVLNSYTSTHTSVFFCENEEELTRPILSDDSIIITMAVDGQECWIYASAPDGHDFQGSAILRFYKIADI